MANDIGGAVNLLKQMLADDNMRDTLTGLLGGLSQSSDDHVESEEIVEEENTQDEVMDAQISMMNKKADGILPGLLPGLLGNMDIQSIYNNVIGCDDKRIVLLNALRPYLNHRRCAKIDSAITVMQLLSISSSLGINKMFGR